MKWEKLKTKIKKNTLPNIWLEEYWWMGIKLELNSLIKIYLIINKYSLVGTIINWSIWLYPKLLNFYLLYKKTKKTDQK